MATSSSKSVRGTVLSFNLSPKGVPEGLLVRVEKPDAGSVVQVNFEPELAAQVLAIIDERAAVSVEVRPFRDAKHDAAHDVYELIRLDADGGKSVTADGPADERVRVQGTIVRLNHARRGEVNGAILDTGDFVHLRPHGAKLVGLEVGQSLDVTGEVRAGWSGHRVIEAHAVNGLEIGKPPKKPHHHDHHPHPHHPPKPHHLGGHAPHEGHKRKH